MKRRLRVILLPSLAAIVFASAADAGVIFRPGQKAKFVAPGEEEISGNAQELFDKAQAAEKAGNLGGAIKAYNAIVRRHPKDALAAGAAYRKAELLEQTHDLMKAAEAYRVVVEKYPKFEQFDAAIEAQFRIGEIYLHGKRAKFLGMPLLNALDKAVDMFAAIIRTAPYGKYTARAQFDIGLAREKQGNNDAAIQAYQAVVDKFPNDPVAADAQYQIGYIWFHAAREGTKDAAAASKAKIGFEDFLFRHPNSEKSAQAREDLRLLEHKQTTNAFQVAKFYDKQKNYRAAVIYYNEVLRQQPGSPEGDHAKKRVDQLRAKLGDAALQPAVAAGPATKKSKATAAVGSPERTSEPMPKLPPDAAPLPPADADFSLPPPASLMPDTTSAPVPSSAPASSDTAKPESAATPEPSATPD